MKRSASARLNRCLFETLEPRVLLSATLRTAPTAGTLFVAGTAGNDSIVLSLDAGDTSKIDVVENGTTQQFNAADVHYIQIFAGNGNDYIRVDETNGLLPVGINVSAGKGNDTVIGSSLDDNIWGDAGNDYLYGYGGNDRLYGMKNDDHIWTGTGDDYVEGNKGNDSLQGSTGTATLDGGDGNDNINSGTSTTSKIIGGKGANHINDAISAGVTPPLEQTAATLDANGDLTTDFDPAPTGYSPSQIKTAYDFTDLPATTTGTGQAIAIVDAYDDPTALQDLTTFSTRFGLTAPTTSNFQVVYAAGNRPGIDPTGTFDWEFEEKLDVQWVHAIAPDAKIYLVEAASNSNADLAAATKVASDTLISNFGGGVVSMSFGAPSEGGASDFEPIFTNSKYRPITYVVSAGDKGAELQYPSSSPEVLAVGGTNLPLDSAGNLDGTEAAWTDGGGGVSSAFTAPAYQLGLTVNQEPIGDRRVVPDVAYDADPATGFSVYATIIVSPTFTDTGYLTIGGTSAGAPQWAAMMGLVNQERRALKLNFLGQADAKIYALATASPATYFNDITTGTTGFEATPGFDLATGWGTPKAAALINGLADAVGSNVGEVSFDWNAEYKEAISKYPGGVDGPLFADFKGGGTAVIGDTVVNLEFSIDQQYNGELLELTATNLTRTADNHVYGRGYVTVIGPLTEEFTYVDIAGGITYGNDGSFEIKGTFNNLDPVTLQPPRTGLDESFIGGFSSY